MNERRAKYRKGLHGLYLPIYDALCGILPEEWQPYYGFLSLAEQDARYEAGRTLPGVRTTGHRGGESAHNFGCASDWTVWTDGRPKWMGPGDSRWKVYENAIEKAQGEWGFWDNPPHNQLPLKVPYKLVYPEYLRGGFDAARTFIEENVNT